jgi:hypothetical protein
VNIHQPLFAHPYNHLSMHSTPSTLSIQHTHENGVLDIDYKQNIIN